MGRALGPQCLGHDGDQRDQQFAVALEDDVGQGLGQRAGQRLEDQPTPVIVAPGGDRADPALTDGRQPLPHRVVGDKLGMALEDLGHLEGRPVAGRG